MTLRRAGLAGILAVALALVGAGPAGQTQAPAPPALGATAHPPVPMASDLVWLAADERSRATAATVPSLANLQEGARRVIEGDYEDALPLLTDASFATTALGDDAAYYAGRAELGLERYAEAQQIFMTLLDAAPKGYLAEGADQGAAAAAEGLDEPEVALELYAGLAARKPASPAQIWLKVGQTATAIEDRDRAAEAFLKVYYEYPLSDEAEQAATELKALKLGAGAPGTKSAYARDLRRAETLYAVGRFADARAAFIDVRPFSSGDERTMVDVHLAACELGLRRTRTAWDRLRPYLTKDTPYQAEARYVNAQAARRLGRRREFVTAARELAKDFPASPWGDAALDALGTYHILYDQDAQAAEVFAALYDRHPSGRYAERAAWKAGWWAWRHGDYPGTVRFFEGAAAGFPRSDYRPQYLYWSGRARERMKDTALARARLALAVTDYGTSYYGRLAARELARLGAAETATIWRAAARDPRPLDHPGGVPPTADRIRLLIAAELYDAAMNEIEYARRQWGATTLLDASRALVLNRQGELRRAITQLKRAYPQYLTVNGDQLPIEVQKVIFPVDFWPLVQKYSAERNLDPFLMAALIAQESTFDASARSGANAYGLMQLVPATGRHVGRSIGLGRVTTRTLTDGEANLRLGTAHFAALMKKFGEVHLALAAYNAGDRRVVAWLKERPGLLPEEFIDDIPFPETQAYVRRILGTAEDYRRIYGSAAIGSGR